MRISTDVLQTLNENSIDVSSAWLWVDADSYDGSYRQVLTQPISLESITLDFLRWKVNTVTLTIRTSYNSESNVIFSGEAALIDDSQGEAIPASADILSSDADKNLIAKKITVSSELPTGAPTATDLFWIVPA